MALTMAYVKSNPIIMLQAHTVTATHTTGTHTCAAHGFDKVLWQTKWSRKVPRGPMLW